MRTRSAVTCQRTAKVCVSLRVLVLGGGAQQHTAWSLELISLDCCLLGSPGLTRSVYRDRQNETEPANGFPSLCLQPLPSQHYHVFLAGSCIGVGSARNIGKAYICSARSSLLVQKRERALILFHSPPLSRSPDVVVSAYIVN